MEHPLRLPDTWPACQTSRWTSLQGRPAVWLSLLHMFHALFATYCFPYHVICSLIEHVMFELYTVLYCIATAPSLLTLPLHSHKVRRWSDLFGADEVEETATTCHLPGWKPTVGGERAKQPHRLKRNKVNVCAKRTCTEHFPPRPSPSLSNHTPYTRCHDTRRDIHT